MPDDSIFRDPVCGMIVNPVPGSLKSDYQGKTYYFCSRDCLTLFSRMPEKFLLQPAASVSDTTIQKTIKNIIDVEGSIRVPHTLITSDSQPLSPVTLAVESEPIIPGAIRLMDDAPLPLHAPPPVAEVKSVILPISGMHCTACSLNIEKSLSALPGVQQAQVNFASEKATIIYAPSQITLAEMIQSITSLGFKVAGFVLTLPIQGIHCASCVSNIEKSLLKLDGILTANVNLATQTATIEYLPGKLTRADIRKAIESAGYYRVLDKIPPKDIESHREKEFHQLKVKFIVGAVISIFVMLVSMPHLLPWMPQTGSGMTGNPNSLHYLLLFLTLPVLIWTGSHFYLGAWNNLKHRYADMNTLIALGTSVSFLYSAFVTINPDFFISRHIQPVVYFDTTVMIITMLTLGRLFEMHAKVKTSLAIKKLIGLQPQTARLIKEDKEIDIPIDELLIGDMVLIRSGERIPVDGVVRGGSSVVDESVVTGESVLVEKVIGREVIAGTVNKSGVLKVQTEKAVDDTLLAKIIKMVEKAQGSKAPIQRLVDKIAGVFVPSVLIIAVVTFLGWIFLGHEMSLTRAMLAFVSVLIIACPCSLGLATPTAIMVGTGKAAEFGILVKNVESLEKLYQVDTVVFDKTGTLTRGIPTVTDVISVTQMSSDDLLQMVASVERMSEHPLGEAIVTAAMERHLVMGTADDVEIVPGQGIKATYQGQVILIGNSIFIRGSNIDIASLIPRAEILSDARKTVLYIAIDRRPVGLIALTDSVKSEAPQVIQQLKTMGYHVVMLTGDHQKSAALVAQQIGITDVRAEVLPDKKADIVRELQEQGKKVAMVGDGINDAPALAQADVGIAMGSGTDIAMETADITLMNDSLFNVPASIQLSQRTIKTIRQNLFWAFIYNIVGIPLAALNLLNPMVAASAMACSSVSVVANSLRLRWFKIPTPPR